ncbi:NADH:flavin oxidoreductase [Colwellia sp. D2M02]|uniref:NADH:flavin oxidoreductase n=1 Tax=Colwellia sp. D2M02 TaxID=2841562 RepID=UPI001C0A1191|nr:NADH:flavin oxidoreductase [Colwellia sp. D2M02]MBU2891961.1 NADH:flavin oxidoreductase [Colwellia sp. D2M02]
MKDNISTIFSSYNIRNITLKNRLAVAPLTRVSGNEDGTTGPLMKDYYQSFAQGGFGLIITEGIYTDKRYSQCYKFQTGLTDEKQVSSWKTITDAVHSSGGLIFAQLMHAGALSQYNKYRGRGGAPSAIKPLGEEMKLYYGKGDYEVPKEMSTEDIKCVVKGFVNAAILAKEAGFDGVEIHGANGYLLDQFLTVYSNKRTDEYGGELANRLRIYQEIITAVRAAVGSSMIIGVRFSQGKVNDTEYKWPKQTADAKYTFESISRCGVDYIHTTEYIAKAPAFKDSLPLAELAKEYGKVPVIANGGITHENEANCLIDAKQADIVSLGKAALANPNWPNVVQTQQQLKAFNAEMFNPIADLKTANAYFKQTL